MSHIVCCISDHFWPFFCRNEFEIVFFHFLLPFPEQLFTVSCEIFRGKKSPHSRHRELCGKNFPRRASFAVYRIYDSSSGKVGIFDGGSFRLSSLMLFVLLRGS